MLKNKTLANKMRLTIMDCIVLTLSFLFFFIVPLVSFSQEQSLYNTQIDSIKKLVYQSPSDDTVKIKNLFILGSLYFNNNQYDEGFKVINQARELSEKIKFKAGEGLYLSCMVIFHRYSSMQEVFKNLRDNANWNIDDFFQIEPSNTQPDFQLIKSQLFKALISFDTITNKEPLAHIRAALFYRFLDEQKLDSALLHGKIAEVYYDDLYKREEAFQIILEKILVYNNTNNKEALKNEESHAIDYITNTTDKRTRAYMYEQMGFTYDRIRRHSSLIQCFLKANEIWEELGDKKGQVNACHQLGVYYSTLKGQENSLNYFLKEISIRKEIQDISEIGETYSSMTYICIALGKLDDAEKYLLLAKKYIEHDANLFQRARLLDAEGQLLKARKMYPEAISKFTQSAEIFFKIGKVVYLSYQYYYSAQCYQALGNLSESLQNANRAFEFASQEDWAVTKISASLLISELYTQLHNIPKAYEYLKLHNTLKVEWDSKDEINRAADFETQSFLNQNQRKIELLEKNNIMVENRSKSQKLWLIMISGALLSVLLLTFLLIRNIKHKEVANAKLEEQKKEITLKGLELQTSYENLKSTQSQLIQSEKMASLGELTAGIAHEIQNPLNFVNNFSEVSNELMDEMNAELDKVATATHDGELASLNNLQEAKVIATEIKQNLEKINHHGKRADAIVKGMLQHSRKSMGIKEPTDINALSDEYMRLSYHGLRAKDKNFNADFKMNLDPNLPLVSVIPQDIGRVLLNLFNNAFWAVGFRKSESQESEEYKPLVTVSTKKLDHQIEIKISDNGLGIPDNIKDKIFQPFFTTKPPGQGTGLGLSLAYDIVKVHKGEIKVETVENQGTTFIISLPVN